jgi:hypothetical protein
MIFHGAGGTNTKTGLAFEGKTDLSQFLNTQRDYRVEKGNVYYKAEFIARIFKKHGFYKFLDELHINWKDHISRRLFPDDSIFVIVANTLFVLECKFQKCDGSVDEKLQTCAFKKLQYQKLLSPANIEVEYIYILCDWFKQPKYKDVLDYILNAKCYYFFNYIPLTKLGLPVPE